MLQPLFVLIFCFSGIWSAFCAGEGESARMPEVGDVPDPDRFSGLSKVCTGSGGADGAPCVGRDAGFYKPYDSSRSSTSVCTGEQTRYGGEA